MTTRSACRELQEVLRFFRQRTGRSLGPLILAIPIPGKSICYFTSSITSAAYKVGELRDSLPERYGG